MGSPDARAYSRNKRGIAGSLIWINFDRHALLNLVQQCAGMFVADIDEIRPQYSNVSQGGAVFQSSVVRGNGMPASATIDALDQTTLTAAGQQSQLASPWYSDQVPKSTSLAIADIQSRWHTLNDPDRAQVIGHARELGLWISDGIADIQVRQRALELVPEALSGGQGISP
jgi:hypothetical protein